MIKPNFTAASFQKELEKRAAKIHKMIIRRLIELGEKCVKEARINAGYKTQSQNLLNSIGFAVVDHGKIVILTGFEKEATKQGATGEEGIREGRQLAEYLAERANAKGYALIVVAGMHYADYVEATGRNVLASSELLAERELPELLRRLKSTVSRMK